MAATGWQRLTDGWPWFRGAGAYPLAAYSEFMPPPRLGRKPYGGSLDRLLFREDDPFGWHVTEYEEALELRPGLEKLAGRLLGQLVRQARGERERHIPDLWLRHNPYWPAELAHHPARLEDERFVLPAAEPSQ